jgi:hypothetical protein
MTKSNLGRVVETAPEALRGLSREFVTEAVLNLALIAGVIAFGWNLTEIAVIYLVEIAVIYLLFCFAALFTPQPVDDLDGEAWNADPTPLQPISLFPPIYWRNITFVGAKSLFGVIVGGVTIPPVFSSYNLGSGLPPSVSLAVASIILFQLTRAWRYFVVDQSYRDKSPADALTLAFAPVTELLVILFGVIAPVTVVLAGVAFAVDTDLNSPLVLLIYLVPIGVVRTWMGSLDPQTDDFQLKFN